MYYIDLKRVLEEKGKTKYWLSNEIGMRFQALSKLVNNETTSIQFDTLAKICIALDVTPNDIIKIKNK